MLKSIQSPMPRSAAKSNKRQSPQPSPPEVVSPLWLVKGVILTIVAALVCGYLTLCLLFYQGQWQLVLHPGRGSSNTASIAGPPYDLIRFDADESGKPQLVGWWIPSDPGARYSRITVLLLNDGDSDLTRSIPTLASLHTLGVNVFAFDYRGYGQSAPVRPNQQNMTQDAAAALQYLATLRHIPEQEIVPYGIGTGASLATSLTLTHSQIPALILDEPRADLLSVALQDRRGTFIPVRLLFHERFPLRDTLSTLQTPKLLISRHPVPDAAYRNAADPKTTLELPSSSQDLYAQSVTRFLDQYLPAKALTP
jgi:pimeloyl-ACP methyl ester carboxylesterase